MKTQSTHQSFIQEDELIQHVERICKSPEFSTKPVLCRFLSYIVSETLSGRGEEIKAYSIGVDVFNRDEDFDPGQDTLVRINAIRLRRTLDQYYNNTGKNDTYHIHIAKGGYMPSFNRVKSKGEIIVKPVPEEKKRQAILDPNIAILSFRDLSDSPDNSFFSKGFAHELIVELSKYEDLQVFNYLSLDEPPERNTMEFEAMKEKGIRFAIGGVIHGDENRINILVDLHDLFEGKQIWREKYSEKITSGNFIEIQEHISALVASRLGSEYGIILQKLTLDAQRQKPSIPDTYTAVLKYYHFLYETSPESAAQAFEAVTTAVKNDPHSAIATASLAALHGNNYALDFAGADESYKILGELAEKAYVLDPYGLFVQLVLGFKCLLYEEKRRFFQIADRMLNNNPNGTLRLGSLGFHMALYGDWERGKKILDSLMMDNLEYPRYFYGVTSLYYYRKSDYESALNEAYLYSVPGFFWGPMLRASALGQLNRKMEAKPELDRLLELKPDFPGKAHYLISRFVKDDSLVDHVVEGLQKAGLSLQPPRK